jgi:F-type H+-transporting ATPase subunit b
MLIDWFTVGAQALNFVILMALMKRFLYQPVLDAIDAREQRIASELADAAKKQTEAQTERDEFQRKNDEFDQQRAELLKQAKADANSERQNLLDSAHRSADALLAKQRESLASEARSLVQAVGQRAQAEVFAIARRTLTDLADASLDASACAIFIARLQGLEGKPRDALAAALGVAGEAVIVRSAFELPSAQRQAISMAIGDAFDAKPELRFAVDPSLVAGIELIAQGHKFAWSITDYLASIERGVSELLKARVRAPAAIPVPTADPSASDSSARPGAERQSARPPAVTGKTGAS